MTYGNWSNSQFVHHLSSVQMIGRNTHIDFFMKWLLFLASMHTAVYIKNASSLPYMYIFYGVTHVIVVVRHPNMDCGFMLFGTSTCIAFNPLNENVCTCVHVHITVHYIVGIIFDQVFEGNRHEVLHDKDQERAREMIKEWVLAHLTVSPQSTSTQSKPTESGEVDPEKAVEEQLDTQEKEPEVDSSGTPQVEATT